MPHSRKLIKVTGDTHPPELEDDFGSAEDEAATAAGGAPLAEGSAPSPGTAASTATAATTAATASTPRAGSGTRTLVVSMPAREYVDAARDQVRARPLSTAAIAFFAGFAIAVVTRSR